MSLIALGGRIAPSLLGGSITGGAFAGSAMAAAIGGGGSLAGVGGGAGSGRVLDFRRRGAPPRRRRRSPLLALARPAGIAAVTVALPIALGLWLLTAREFQLRTIVVGGPAAAAPATPAAQPARVQPARRAAGTAALRAGGLRPRDAAVPTALTDISTIWKNLSGKLGAVIEDLQGHKTVARRAPQRVGPAPPPARTPPAKLPPAATTSPEGPMSAARVLAPHAPPVARSAATPPGPPVVAAARVPAAWVRQALAPLLGRNLLRLPLAEVRLRLAANPWIAAAEVAKELPDRLRVTVAERRPAVLLRLGEALFYADAAGRPIAPAGAPAAAAEIREQGLLVVSLPPPPKPSPGPPMLAPPPAPVDPGAPEALGAGAGDGMTAAARAGVAGALQLAAQLRLLRPQWTPALSRIDVVDEDDFQLHVAGLPCLLLVRGSRLADNLVRFEQLLPELRRRYPALAAVDLRYSRRIVVQPAPGSRSSETL